MDVTRREFTLASLATAIGLSLPAAAVESLERIVEFRGASGDLREVVSGLMRFHDLQLDAGWRCYRAVATLDVWPGSRGEYVKVEAAIAFMVDEGATDEQYEYVTNEAISGMLRFLDRKYGKGFTWHITDGRLLIERA